MTNESNYVDDTCDGLRDIRATARILNSLADALLHTGNPLLADRLGDCSDNLQSAAKQVSDAIGREINDSCARSNQATNDMISSAMAAITTKSKL